MAIFVTNKKLATTLDIVKTVTILAMETLRILVDKVIKVMSVTSLTKEMKSIVIIIKTICKLGDRGIFCNQVTHGNEDSYNNYGDSDHLGNQGNSSKQSSQTCTCACLVSLTFIRQILVEIV
jgi:hypothetical protein